MKRITIHDKNSLPAGQSIATALQQKVEGRAVVDTNQATKPTPYGMAAILMFFSMIYCPSN